MDTIKIEKQSKTAEIGRTIIKTMNENALEKIEISYSGSGDSGDEIYWDFTPDRELPNETKILLFGNGPEQGLLEKFCDAVLVLNGCDEFYNGNGGGGIVCITNKGQVTHGHSDYVDSEETTDHTMLLNSEILQSSKAGQYDETKYSLTELQLGFLVNAMIDNGLIQIVITHQGGGDSGQTEDVTFLACDGEIDAGDISIPFPGWSRDGKPKISVLATPFPSAADFFAESVIREFGHDGYWNNEGGIAVITVNQSGSVEYTHTDYSQDYKERQPLSMEIEL